MMNSGPPAKASEPEKAQKEPEEFRLPDLDNPVDPACELIEDDGLDWKQRAEIEARGRFVNKLHGKE